MDTKFLDDYLKNDYEPLTDQFLQKTIEYLDKNQTEMTASFMKAFEQFCWKLKLLQNEAMIDAGAIQISLLRTSVYFGTPSIRFDAYDKYGVFGGNILHEDVEFPYLFHYWKEWEEALRQAVKTKHYEQYVTDEKIRVLMGEKFKMLLYFFVVHVKYKLEDLDQYEWFQAVQKEEKFAVSVGEFEDWQKTVYGEFPFVDIFFNMDEEVLQYQKYNQLVFKDKEFTRMDLSKIRFTDCHFINCTIKDTKFHDTSFLGCRFYNTVIEDSTFYGSLWKDCLIQKSQFIQCDFWKEENFIVDPELPPEPIEDIYREVLMKSCSFKRVLMKYCNLSHVKVTDEHMVEVDIIDKEDGGESV